MSLRLKELRKANKLRQKDIANIANVGQVTVSKWELGKNQLDIETGIILANYFNVSLDYLYGRTDIDIFLGTKDQTKLVEDPQGIFFKNSKYLSNEDQKRLMDYINLLIVWQKFKDIK